MAVNVQEEMRAMSNRIAELESERDTLTAENSRLREALQSEIPLAPFGDILGHNYWMDANTLRSLWRRMTAAALAKEVGRG